MFKWIELLVKNPKIVIIIYILLTGTLAGSLGFGQFSCDDIEEKVKKVDKEVKKAVGDFDADHYIELLMRANRRNP